MRRVAVAFLVMICILSMIGTAMAAPGSATRIKDMAKVQGVRSNQLVGYGLVIGLNGTGDSNKTLQTMQSLSSMLTSFGVTVSPAQMQAKNVAAVIVTAELPPFTKPGDTIDITISSMGDAKNLQGGILLQTPIRGADGQVYAVGQGPVSTGGSSTGGGASQSKNFPTVGTTPNGAIVERDVPVQLVDNGAITLSLSQPDFTTAKRISAAIENRFSNKTVARDPGTIVVTIPDQYKNDVVGFVSILEELLVEADSIAKIIINERTGTIVMGSRVTIDQVAIAQGGLSIRINNTDGGGSPSNKATGTQQNVLTLPVSTTVEEVAQALNAIGATPRDIISIFQAMKAAGALHAELQII